MYANRKAKRSNLNLYFFTVPFEEEKINYNLKPKYRNTSVNPKCVRWRKADRGH